MKTYKVGDTVNVEVELRDNQSGVGQAQGVFRGVAKGRAFTVSGDGGGQTYAKVSLIAIISNDLPADEYKLETLIAYDTAGNRLTANPPNIELRIEHPSGDQNPPELISATLK